MKKISKSDRVPIAIVGISCRLPNHANNPEEYFKKLYKKECMLAQIDEVCERRVNLKYYKHYYPKKHPKHISCPCAGIVDDVEKFDYTAFNFNKVEANQQALPNKVMLELAVEAFEDANIKCKGSLTGVFIGGPEHGYFDRKETATEYLLVGQYKATLSNIVSFKLDLRGPSHTVLSACCSSGTAFHNAMLSIRAGDCDMALAGGVGLFLDPNMNSQFDMLNVLSPDGKPKVFDENANGFVSSDGFGLVVLKRLDQALKDGNKIYAIVRDSIANADGATTKIFTNPSKIAHRANISRLMKRNEIDPNNVAFFEMHATGTVVGDPIETEAVGMEIGQFKKKDDPLLIGSVKGNIGHTVSAAFVSSLIKVCMMIKHKVVLPNIGFKTPNKRIKWKKWNVKVPTDVIKKDFKGKNLLLNTFGIGGSNVTVLLEGVNFEDYLKPNEPKLPWKAPHLFTVYGKTAENVNNRIKQLKEFSESVKDDARLMYTLNTRKQENYDFRSVAVHKDFKSAKFSQPERINFEKKKKVCFVFSGQGPQNLKMGRQLYQEFPAFKETIDKCDEIYKKFSGSSMIYDVGLFGEKVGTEADLKKSENTIPSLIMIQIALIELWKSIGIVPDVVLGHSFGEICSMYASGAATLEEVLRIVYARVTIVNEIKTEGKLMAVGIGETEFYDDQEELDLEDIWIAANNAPKSITVGGSPEDVLEMAKYYKKKGVFHRVLNINFAFHTPRVDEIKDIAMERFEKALKGTRAPKKTMLSTTFATKVRKKITAEFLTDNITSDVKFVETISKLVLKEKEFGEDTVFIELAAHPVLGRSLREIGCENILYSLNRKFEEKLIFLKNVAKLVTFGFNINWKGLMGEGYSPFVELPSYPWTKDLCLIQDCVQFDKFMVTERKLMPPTIGRKQEMPNESWKTYVSLKRFPWIKDHTIMGRSIVPAAMFTHMLFECANDTKLKNLGFFATLECRDKNDLTTTCVIENGNQLQVWSRAFGRATKAKWVMNSSGERLEDKLSSVLNNEIKAPNVEEILKRCKTEVKAVDFYRATKEFMNMEFGKCFQRLVKGWRGDGEALSIVNTDVSNVEKYAELKGYVAHPVVLDGIFHSMLVGLKYFVDCFYPVNIGEIVVLEKQFPKEVYVHMSRLDLNEKRLIVDSTVFDKSGKVYMIIKDFIAQRVVIRKDKPVPTYSFLLQSKELPNLKDEKVCEKMNVPQVKVNETIHKKILYYCRKALPSLNKVYDSLPNHNQRQIRWVRQLITKKKDIVVPQSVIDCDLKKIKGWEIPGEIIDRVGPRFTSMAINKNNEVADVYFTDGILAKFYYSLAILPAYCQMIEHYVKTFTKEEGRVLRILELGAGTGSVARALFPLLKKYETKVEFIFTDISTGYFNNIREEFKDYKFLRFKLLDCEKPYSEQGIPDYSIDIVLSFLVIHVAGYLKNAFKYLHKCLVPNGLLLLAEVDSPIHANFIFGFFDQWWLAKDWRKDSERLNVCMKPEEFVKVLEETNFRVTDKIMEDGEGNKMCVIQARKLELKDKKIVDSLKHDVVLSLNNPKKFELLDLVQSKINKEGCKEKKVLLVIGLKEDNEDAGACTGIATTCRMEFDKWRVSILHFEKGIADEKIKYFLEDAEKYPSKYELENIISKEGKVSVPRMKLIPNELEECSIDIKTNAFRLEKVEKEENSLYSVGFYEYEMKEERVKSDEVLIKVIKNELTEMDFEFINDERVQEMNKNLSVVLGVITHIGSAVKDVKINDEVIAIVVNKSSMSNYIVVKNDFVCVKKKVIKNIDLRSFIAVKAFQEANVKCKDVIMIHGGVKNEYIIQLCGNIKDVSIIVSVKNESEGKYLNEKYSKIIKKIVLISDFNWNKDLLLDVVFSDLKDSLSLEKSFESLKQYGTFIQLHKDFEKEKFTKKIMELLFLKGIKYVPIDIISKQREIKTILKDTLSSFEKGELKLVNVESFEVKDFFTSALEVFKKKKNYSKRVCITWNDKKPSFVKQRTAVFSCNKTYVISGGLGEVGWNLIKKMSKFGGRYVVVLSRSGKTTKQQKKDIAELKKNDFHIYISKTDVTDEKAVAEMYKKIPTLKFPKIGGILHMALVLKDEFVEKIKKDDFEYVENIKKLGAINLMKPFKSPKDLDFVMWFSSVSSTVGNARQVNYNAGNRYLEFLSRKMRKEGWNSYCVNIGSIVDAGISGWNFAVRRNMATWKQIPVRFLLRDLFKLIRTGKCKYVSEHQRLFGVDLSGYKSNIEYFYGHLFNTQAQSSLKKIKKGEAITYDVLNTIVKDLLMLDKDVKPDEDLIYFGVDSVQSIELSSILWKKLGLKVSQADLMNQMTINKLLKIASK